MADKSLPTTAAMAEAEAAPRLNPLRSYRSRKLLDLWVIPAMALLAIGGERLGGQSKRPGDRAIVIL